MQTLHRVAIGLALATGEYYSDGESGWHWPYAPC